MYKIKIKKIILLIFCINLALTLNANADSANLFNTVEFKSKKLTSVPKWVNLLDRMLDENKKLDACSKNQKMCDDKFFKQWLNFIAQAKLIKDDEELLDSVNAFFNDWEYIVDMENWNVSDYWEIPREFLEMSGDCEDYAIIKYYTLKKLGYDTNKLRIVILKDVVRNGAHAVLAVYKNDSVYILDNLSTIALTDDLLTQYVPYYSINENNKWIHFKKM
jgi:predicted transglutaminase-like cysteine proteinase